MEPVKVVTMTAEELEQLQERIIRAAEERVEAAIRRANAREYLTVREASKELGWSERQVRYKISSGELNYVKVAGTVRIRYQDIRDYLEAGSISRPH
jgi:excisionase family DNA binding protein